MNEEAIQMLTKQLDRIERLTLIGAKNVLDLEEASCYTGYSVGHIYRLTSNRGIPHYKQGRKLYFNKSELDRWMQEIRISTTDEIDSMAATYIATH